MNVKKGRWVLTGLSVLVVLLLCAAFASCGRGGEAADVECEIAVTQSGSAYTATIEFPDGGWAVLTEAQRGNVVDQCVETIELDLDTEETADAEPEYSIIGIEQRTKQQIFTYDSGNQETRFPE